jgi:alpha-amylase
MKRTFLILFLVIFLTSCGPGPTSTLPVATSPVPIPTVTASPTITPTPENWWDHAVFYEIFVRSFYDSDGNGIGDFNGITEKLDYLKDLGINAIWLMPIHPSPSYHGYDVIDYFKVNPDYGTMDDFKRLLSEAHKRDIRIIIDLVLNHTSSQNPWFIDSNNNPQSPYRNWYIWSATNPGYNGPLGPAWHAGLHGYYYGIFNAGMPDLNYKDPALTAEMENVVKFWLNDVGIDGFRLDAVNYLVEEGQKQVNTQSTHNWLKGFYLAYKADKPDAFTVGEVFGAGASIAKTYTGNQLDEIFSFEMASGFVNSARGEANSAVDSGIQFSLMDMPEGPYATFLTNHDQNRVMSVLNGDVNKAKVAASLLLTSPGTPFIYYGEEIGMQGEKPDEEIRLPMQWSAGPNAGFTTGKPWEATSEDYSQSNVANELSDPNSLLSYYHSLIALRSQHPAIYGPGIKLVTTNNIGVYAALRFSQNEKILVLTNLTGSPISDYSLGLKTTLLQDGSYQLKPLFGAEVPSDLTISGGAFNNYTPLTSLPPFTTLVFLIETP